MLQQASLLVRIVKLIDQIPKAPVPAKRKRGKPKYFSDLLILKALVIMIIRRLYGTYAFLQFLKQDDYVVKQLREQLKENGRFPSRRTWERRLGALPSDLPGLIGRFGRQLTELLKPWIEELETVSFDSTALKTGGGVWHKKDRLQGVIPHTSIDTEAQWGKSGWHSWRYCWKLHLAVSAGRIWIPLAAELTAANVYDGTIAPLLLAQLSEEVFAVLGDRHYDDPELHRQCCAQQRLLITTKPGPYPHSDPGVDLRREFHKLRSQSIEPFHGLFKTVFDWRSHMPMKGSRRTKLFALGAVFLYQLVLLYQYKQNLTPGVGIKPLLRAA